MRPHPGQGWLLVVLLTVLAGCQTATSPTVLTVAGIWNISSYSDSGHVAVATGTWTFATDGNWSALGSATYPGGQTRGIVGLGTWAQNGFALTLNNLDGTTGVWDLAFSGNRLVLTGRPPVLTVVTLTRTARSDVASRLSTGRATASGSRVGTR